MIKDVESDDHRIQITGYVKELAEEEHFVLDDSTGKMGVDINNIDFEFKENDLVNVIGEIVKNGNEKKIIKAEIVQDKNKLNFEYYKKLYELKKNYG
jgi:uncharacterized protein YdeI (BOF family)